MSERFLAAADLDQDKRTLAQAKLASDRVLILAKQGLGEEALQAASPLLRESFRGRDDDSVAVPRANVLVTCALLRAARGGTRSAMRMIEQARRIRLRRNGPVRVARVDLWLAALEVESGDVPGALRRVDEAERTLLRKGHVNPRCAHVRAAAASARGDTREAERWLERALAISEGHRARLDSEDFRISYHGAMQEPYVELLRLRRNRPARAFATAERAQQAALDPD